MNRRLALAALIAIPLLALVFRGLGATGLRPLTAYLAALAVYWGLLGLALWLCGGWSLRPRWPGWPVALLLGLTVAAMAAGGAQALTGLSGHVLVVVVLAAAINGHLEEAFWRGALIPDPGPGGVWPVVPAVLLFGLWHLAPAAASTSDAAIDMPGGAPAMILGATLLGALFMAARLRSGTAGAGAIAHALVNLFGFGVLAATNAHAL